MGGKLDVYLDIASLYSYVAFAYLQQHTSELAAHGVEIEYHPVLLGAINASTGNRPPWTVPAKASYLKHDASRSLSRVSLPPSTAMPPDFMARANTLLPLRCLTYIKYNFPPPPSSTSPPSRDKHPQNGSETFVAALAQLLKSFWIDHSDLNDPSVLSSALLSATSNFAPVFASPGQVAQVVSAAQSDATLKAKVKDRTREAVEEKGAFGAPWIWATNDAGKGEPFFGSDRFHHVYLHLGVPFTDVTIVPPASRAPGGSGGKTKL
ncbi:DSBA-like thioredoxin domain-containing protein [Zalerion maritima]|uniref:DSBA-like thioredoxin domain-containing protein n=1 Tax=Zalerion maritima TaxID=339359 RepID=A0AAD5WV98_9PEZI|nr:DSBA-like thioredoxin domain-containing protein [Zalerion maritima]